MSMERKFPSVKAQIESTPKISELEAHYVKESREDMRNAWTIRTPDSVWHLPGMSGKFDVHTHPKNIKPSLPSFQDLYSFRKIASKVMVIASTDSKGTVTGYTFVNKETDRENRILKPEINDDYEGEKRRTEMIERQIKELRLRIIELISKSKTPDTMKQIDEDRRKWGMLGDEYVRIVLERVKKFNWQMRFVPMEGYEFRHGYFSPKPSPPPPGGAGTVADGPSQEEQERIRIEKRRWDELQRLRRLNAPQRLRN